MADKGRDISLFGPNTLNSDIKVPYNYPAAFPTVNQLGSPGISIPYDQPAHPKMPMSNLYYGCKPKESIGKGFGLFAEQDIPKGKAIIIERPSLVHGPLTQEQGTFFWYDLKNVSSSFAETDFLDKFMELSLEDQSDIMLLENCHEEAFQSRKLPLGKLSAECTIIGKFLTNRFRMSLDLAGLYFRCSFLNHSCEPNCSFRMITRNGLILDPGHRWLLIRAKRDIKAGDELTISYIPRTTAFEERQSFLFWFYGFRCDCSRCLKDKTRLYPDGRESYVFKKKQTVELQRLSLNNLYAIPQGRNFLTVVRAIISGSPLFPKNGIVLEETPLMLITKEELMIIRTDTGERQDYHPMMTRFLQLSFETRKEFLSLHSLDSSQGSLPGFISQDSIPSLETLLNIWKANKIALDAGMEGVFPIISNLSHSCKPTCEVSWNSEQKTLNLVAIKTLQIGDEITICYGGIKISSFAFRARQRYLKESYGFCCCCFRCMNEIRWEIPRVVNPRNLKIPLEEYCSQNIQKNFGNTPKSPYRLSKSCLPGTPYI